ncbi:hypothetical protein CSB20_11955 [bacterium DOLZORAL124_64_63]|nr:MAG: hypothetical protein CSB20_11955 [bacterium DOLZORAL124_64_63]
MRMLRNANIPGSRSHPTLEKNMIRIALAISMALVLTLPAGAAWAQQDWPAGFQPTEQVDIPGGRFQMGRPGQGHPVVVSAFRMDKHEVTNAQWQAFCEATGRQLPIFWGIDRFRCGPDFPNHPVVGVSHSDARAYAKWVGRRLPTEAEWERAARGGLDGTKYDTGDKLAEGQANTKSAKLDGPVAVMSFRPNGYGLYDTVGNVREWVADYYTEEDPPTELLTNPTGPENGRLRLIKGGGWFSGNGCNQIHVRNALHGSWGDFNVGFRCASDLEKPADAP